MPGYRKIAEQICYEALEEILPGSTMPELYRQKFQAMNDDEFEAFMLALENGTVQLAIIAPNFGKPQLSAQRNFELAEKWGFNFFQRIHIPAMNGLPGYLTPVPYLVVDLPVRRQAQMLDKKISVPEDNLSVDDFTGQVTGKSKSSSISYPQVQVIAARGKEQILTEFLKYRGGDQKGFYAMNTMIARTGGVSMKAIEKFSGGVRSTITFRTLLRGMHLDSTL